MKEWFGYKKWGNRCAWGTKCTRDAKKPSWEIWREKKMYARNLGACIFW